MWYYVTRFFPYVQLSHIFSHWILSKLFPKQFIVITIHIYIYTYDPITYELCHVNTWKSSHIVMKSTSHSRFSWHNFHNLQCSSFPHVSSHELASGWPTDGPSALQSATGASSLHPERPPSSISVGSYGRRMRSEPLRVPDDDRAQHLLAPRSGATTILGAVGWNFGCLCHPQRLEVHLLPQRSSRLCPATPKPAALRSCTSSLTVWDGSSRPWEVTSAGDDLGLTLRADLQPTPNDPWPLELQDQHPSLQFLSILWELNQRYTLW